jgi:hypothetical protein
MVVVEGIKRAGKDPTRKGFISALESIQDMDVGLGDDFLLNYSPTDHQGAHKVFFTILRNGKLETLTNWQIVKKK